MRRRLKNYISMVLALTMIGSLVFSGRMNSVSASTTDNGIQVMTQQSVGLELVEMDDDIVVSSTSHTTDDEIKIVSVDEKVKASVSVADAELEDSGIEIEGDNTYDAGKSVPLHIGAFNKQKEGVVFRLYFWDYDGELPDDTKEWEKILTVPCTDIIIKNLDKDDEISVDVVSDEKTTIGKAALLQEKTDNQKLSARFLELKLPADSSIDFDINVSSEIAETVTIVPVVIEDTTETYFEAETISWESSDSDISIEGDAELANGVVSIENGKIIKEDGSIEYGSPENGQEYVESYVEPSNEEAEYFDRYAYHPSEYQVMAMDTSVTNLSANIRKRTQWTDETNGNGKVTLQYTSNSGTINGTEDMNLVLIQDKSGSTDCNYGYNLEVVRKGWSTRQSVKWFPIQNSMGWAETVSDIAEESGYWQRIHMLSSYPGFQNGWLYNGEMGYNSPCQLDGHYYLLINPDATSSLPAWIMVQGNNLYNITNTDFHHYEFITRDEAVNTYIPQGRRVVRVTSGYYVNESGRPVAVSSSNPAYFLDVSQIVEYNGKWILSTCALGECQSNDRLAKSQDFMNTLVTQIHTLNPSNKIAYVPFWGDVPNNGSWSNASSNNTTNGLYADNEGRMTYKSGVTKIDFTTNVNTIKNQIDNPFTYDGTNWSRAFQNVLTFMNNRSAEDKAKKTLVIFLTDGMPQGTAGKPQDVNNPRINGVNEVAQLKAISGVTIYACGVGVNNLDKTGLKDRLDQIDSTGTFAYARQPEDFETLKTEILNRINNQYVIEIKGQDAFYTDTLSGPFSLDESNLNSSWKVLASPGSGVTKGVPTTVYNAAKSGAKYIYVRSTKTVYWYIGSMTNGGYTASGHQMSFPIKYADYQVSTDGKDKAIASNTVQKLTYVTTQNPNELLTKSMSTPTIIFSRQAKPSITVNKTVSGSSFTKDMTYRFVYSTKKQTSGKVTEYIGAVNVTVKAGQSSGSAVIENVNPGTYYVYEVDANDNMISSQVGTVSISEDAAITTVGAGGSIPLSVRSSDGATLSNLDNVLRITTKSGSVSFKNEYVDVNVNKIWKDENYAKRPQEVTIWLLKNGTKIQSMKLSESNNWKGSFKNLEKYDASGKAYQYTVSEDEVIGYTSDIQQTKDTDYMVTNELLYGNIKLRKLDSDGKTPLQGAVFELKDNTGKVVATKSTDSKGEVLFEHLYPDIYTVTETETTEGHTLLKEPLTITLPMQVTEKDIDDMGIDKDKCIHYPVANVYLIYDYTYEITNHATFDVPMTGGMTTARTFLPLIAGLVILIGLSVAVMRKKRR